MNHTIKRYDRGGYGSIKRVMDLIISSVLLVFMLVPMLVISIAVFLQDGGKVIFAQERIGQNGERFTIYKFRTMYQNTPAYLSTREAVLNNHIITPVGYFLRATSLDELPQLFNVLKGDMSLIGPRPLIPNEIWIHRKREEYGVYAVKPGITGWAQVHGRDMVSDDEKAEMDLYYLNHYNFITDVQVIGESVLKVLSQSDIDLGNMKTDP